MKEQFKIWLQGILVRIKRPFIYVCLFLGLLLIAYIAGRCSTGKERKIQISNIIAARDSVKQSFVTIDGLRNSVYEKNAIILSQVDAIKAGIIERDQLKALHLSDLVTSSNLKGTINILRDSLKAPPQTVFINIKDTSGMTHDYVRIPFTLLDINEKYLSLKTGMRSDRSAYFNLSVPFSGTMSIGHVGTGFLHLKSVPKGVFTTEDPYIKINNMDILIIEDPKKWYEKWWVHALVGGAAVEGARILLKK